MEIQLLKTLEAFAIAIKATPISAKIASHKLF